MKKEGSNEVDHVDRAKMWKKARVNKQGQYDNDDIQQIVHKIVNSSSVNRHYSNDVLIQALGKRAQWSCAWGWWIHYSDNVLSFS
ncbi:hypothetical protein IC582_020708 [Cucumis melo]